MGTAGTNLVIVALPSDDDYVRKISSEKVPHLTLLFLGENKLGDQTSHVVDYVEHAASTLERFGLSVDRRGELGEDKADVLFFEKAYAKKLEQFRSHLLANTSIAAAYHSTPQFPTWTPHLTLGYPETPAKPDNRDYPGISWVNFDRIAIWTGDYEGPTFQLESNDRLEEVYMSQEQQAPAVEEFLTHFGVKGMRWGVRKSGINIGKVYRKKGDEAKADIARSAARKKTLPESADAKKAAAAKAKVGRKGNTKALTNDELQALVKRMNLEKQYKTLSTEKAVAPAHAKLARSGAKFTNDVVGGIAKQQATRVGNDFATQYVNDFMKTAMKK